MDICNITSKFLYNPLCSKTFVGIRTVCIMGIIYQNGWTVCRCFSGPVSGMDGKKQNSDNSIMNYIVGFILHHHGFIFQCSLYVRKAEITTHNWKNWTRVFLPCFCHELYRVEAAGLKIAITLKKITFLRNFQIFDLIWHETKIIGKTVKNENAQLSNEYFKSIKHFKSNI